MVRFTSLSCFTLLLLLLSFTTLTFTTAIDNKVNKPHSVFHHSLKDIKPGYFLKKYGENGTNIQSNVLHEQTGQTSIFNLSPQQQTTLQRLMKQQQTIRETTKHFFSEARNIISKLKERFSNKVNSVHWIPNNQPTIQQHNETVTNHTIYEEALRINNGQSDVELFLANQTPHNDSSYTNFTTLSYQTSYQNVTYYMANIANPINYFHVYPAPRTNMFIEEEITMEKPPQNKQWCYSAHSSVPHTHADGDVQHSANPILLEMAAEYRYNAKCDGTEIPSKSSQHYGCLIAMNAGFFDMQHHSCLGNVVSESQIINTAGPDFVNRVNFGVTNDGHFIIGYISSKDFKENKIGSGFAELAQGQGWLIRDGQSYLNQSIQHEKLSKGFVDIKAPRNAIGHDKEGHLYLFQADGEEDIKLGPDLYEWTEILLSHGMINAVNLDGGGSSVTIYKDKVFSKPTCADTPRICERAVTTITCVMP